jgi:hypothetical protein
MTYAHADSFYINEKEKILSDLTQTPSPRLPISLSPSLFLSGRASSRFYAKKYRATGNPNLETIFSYPFAHSRFPPRPHFFPLLPLDSRLLCPPPSPPERDTWERTVCVCVCVFLSCVRVHHGACACTPRITGICTSSCLKSKHIHSAGVQMEYKDYECIS